jgi:Flp pilus assembly pilin Flp
LVEYSLLLLLVAVALLAAASWFGATLSSFFAGVAGTI